MSIKENFSNPKGLLGSFMLSGMNKGHTPMAKWGFSRLDLPEKGDVADIGCGGGYNVKRLLETVKAGHVYGVDISEQSVKKSKAVNKDELGRRCEIFRGSAEKLPFENDALDFVTAFETVYFWPDILSCFKEIRRTLKTGGKFAVINDPGDPEKHWEEKIPHMTAYSAQEIRDLMEQAGFGDITVAEEKYMYCVAGIKK